LKFQKIVELNLNTNGGKLQDFNRLSETKKNNLQSILALVVQLLACFFATSCSYHKSIATYYFVGHVWCKFFLYKWRIFQWTWQWKNQMSYDI